MVLEWTDDDEATRRCWHASLFDCRIGRHGGDGGLAAFLISVGYKN